MIIKFDPIRPSLDSHASAKTKATSGQGLTGSMSGLRPPDPRKRKRVKHIGAFVPALGTTKVAPNEMGNRLNHVALCRAEARILAAKPIELPV
jgi:hypothetical protein